jgi:hypothetical protein
MKMNRALRIQPTTTRCVFKQQTLCSLEPALDAAPLASRASASSKYCGFSPGISTPTCTVPSTNHPSFEDS